MAWFSRFTRFGDAHLVFGQEANMSCGIASILMCVFKINKLSTGPSSIRTNTEVYDAYTKASGSTYKPKTQGTQPELLAKVLNTMNCGTWKGEYVSPLAVSKIIGAKVGSSGGFGPTLETNPVIAGVGWQGGGGHAVVIDTIRTRGTNRYATVCDPWDANVHVVPFDPTKPFDYDASKGGFHVNFWGKTKAETSPYNATSTGKAIAIIYRI